MNRKRLMILIIGAAMALSGCGELLDQADLTPEDREALEDLGDALSEAMEDGGNGDSASGNDEAGSPPVDPGWSPAEVPAPPGEPTESRDQSDEDFCPSGMECGWAEYASDDSGEDIRDHYEDVFGRPPDDETRRPAVNNDGESYETVTSEWDDGDATVTVYTDHNGTDVTVRVESPLG